MKLKRTFTALFTTVCAAVCVLLFTVFVAAACSEKVTLRFETGEGSHIASVEGRAGGDYSKPAEPCLDGYYFDGWFLDPAFSGQRQELPERMPEESTTYYAKYAKCPVLTLDGAGGEPDGVRLEVKPGEPLSELLRAHVPQKEGLVFGGWTAGGELLREDVVMGEEDLTLTARYLAEYSLNVYFQLPDSPEEFALDGERSCEGTLWEGERFEADETPPAHFYLDRARSSCGGALQAGENVFSLYFLREQFTVTLDPALPEGGGEKTQLQTRYGAHLTAVRPEGGEGYEFLCWRESAGDHPEGEVVTLTQEATFTGVWANVYPNALGEGTLLVELGNAPVRSAAYLCGETRTAGEFYEENGSFSAGEYRGKLEPHGGFLPDDSGSYFGCGPDLKADPALGTLTLDFFGGTARLTLGDATAEGAYGALYDERTAKYTGEYSFAGGEGFLFRLCGEAFLQKGEEAGEYARYDPVGGDFGEGRLLLDGYGNAELLYEKYKTGRYFRDKEGWRLCFEEGEGRVLLGKRTWADDADLAAENAYLLYDEALAGEYVSESGTLVLDGYGLRGEWRCGERTAAAPFARDGNVVTLFCEPVLRFTLRGSGFSPTSEEAGRYSGALGELVLDGAGGAALAGKEGAYRLSGESWTFEGENTFRFRLQGEEYVVYDPAKEGVFENYFFETALVLDGFGGGMCYLTAGEGFEVRLLYRDETFLLLFSESFKSPRKTAAFRLSEGSAVEIPSVEAGLYPVYENGEKSGETLLLDGCGNARLLACGREGRYSYSHKETLAVCSFGEQTERYRLTEKGREPCCERSRFAGVYEGSEGQLVLDGYGQAEFKGERLPCKFSGGALELDRGEELLRFTLSDGAYALVRYLRYTDPFGGDELFLGQGCMLAIYRGEKDLYGTYGLETFLSEGRSFSYRLRGREFFVYEQARQREYPVFEGGSLSLDGCGYGVFARGEERAEGRVLQEGSYVLLLPAEGGALCFSEENGVLFLLGEAGLFSPSGEGDVLFLRGDGTAVYGTAEGTYAEISEDVYEIFVQGRRFCVRVSRENGGEWALFSPEQERLRGQYSCGGGVLSVDGCSVTLEEGGGRVSYRFVCACADGFLAQNTATGEYFRFRLYETAEITAVNCRFVPDV